MHAVAELSDGKLYVATRFVKAAGGCSAPALKMTADAIPLGTMRFRLLPAHEAQLMIRHPNYSGMQMNQLTRLYIPAEFVQTLPGLARRAASIDGRCRHLDLGEPVIPLRLPAERGEAVPHRGDGQQGAGIPRLVPGRRRVSQKQRTSASASASCKARTIWLVIAARNVSAR